MFKSPTQETVLYVDFTGVAFPPSPILGLNIDRCIKMHLRDQLSACNVLLINYRHSDVREVKVMRTRDHRFTDIAPKVYHTVCNPSKVLRSN